MRSGYINLSESVTNIAAGNYSFTWSSLSRADSNGAFDFIFDDTRLITLNTGYRYYSIPLRCLGS